MDETLYTWATPGTTSKKKVETIPEPINILGEVSSNKTQVQNLFTPISSLPPSVSTNSTTPSAQKPLSTSTSTNIAPVTGISPSPAPPPAATTTSQVQPASGTKSPAQETATITTQKSYEEILKKDPLYQTQVVESARMMQAFSKQMEADRARIAQSIASSDVEGGWANALMMEFSNDAIKQARDFSMNLSLSLAKTAIQRIEESRKTEEAAFQEIFAKALSSGKLEDAWRIAQQMSELYPESNFWTMVAKDPQYQKVLVDSHSAEISSATQKRVGEALAAAENHVDWLDPESINSYFPVLMGDLSSAYGPEREKLLVTAWAENNKAELEKKFETSLDTVPYEELRKAYWKTYINDTIVSKYRQDIAKTVLESGRINLEGFTENGKELLKTVIADLALNPDARVSISGITVPPSLFDDPDDAAWTLFDEPWFPKEVTKAFGWSEQETKVRENNLNKVYLEVLKNADGKPISRSLFLNWIAPKLFSTSTPLSSEQIAAYAKSFPYPQSAQTPVNKFSETLDTLSRESYNRLGILTSKNYTPSAGVSNTYSQLKQMVFSEFEKDPNNIHKFTDVLISKGVKEIPPGITKAEDLWRVLMPNDPIKTLDSIQLVQTISLQNVPGMGLVPVFVTMSHVPRASKKEKDMVNVTFTYPDGTTSSSAFTR